MVMVGTEDEVSSAQTLVWEMLAGVESGSTTWNPKQAMRSSSGRYDSVELEAQITIPQDAAGLILGRSGTVIRGIMAESGAALVVSNKGML
jgi:KH domain